MSVGVRWRPLQATGVVTHLVTRFRDAFCLATWMQTNGTILLAVELRSLACVSWKLKMAVACPGCGTSLLYLSSLLRRPGGAIGQ